MLADADALEDGISDNFTIYLVLSIILIGITLYGSDYKTLESLKMICSCDICHPQLREIFGEFFCFCLTFYEGCGIVNFVEQVVKSLL